MFHKGRGSKQGSYIQKWYRESPYRLYDTWTRPSHVTWNEIKYETDPAFPYRKRPNYCDHWTVKMTNKPGTYKCKGADGRIYVANNAIYTTPWLGEGDIPGFYGDRRPWCPNPDPVDPPLWGEIEKRALGLNNQPQLLNFLAELASAKRLFKEGFKALRSIPKGLPRSLTKRELTDPRELKRFLKKAANADLAFKFGVVAPLKDIFDALEAAAKAGDNLRKVYDQAGKPVKLTYTEAQTSYTKSVPASGHNGSPYTIRYSVKVKRHRFIVVKYTLPPKPRLLEDLHYFISSMGLDNIVSATWEGIPLSFVVDWFFRIGDTLESIEPELFNTTSFTVLSHYMQTVWEGEAEDVLHQAKVLTDRPMVDAGGRVVRKLTYRRFLRERLGVDFKLTGFKPGSGLDSKGKKVTAAELLITRT